MHTIPLSRFRPICDRWTKCHVITDEWRAYRSRDSFCRDSNICHADAVSRERSPHVNIHINKAESSHSSIKGHCKRFFHKWGSSLETCQARAQFLCTVFFKTTIEKRFQKLMTVMARHSS